MKATTLLLLALFLAGSSGATRASGELSVVRHFSWKDLPRAELDENISRRMISGKGATVGLFTFKKGAIVPRHQHPNEQYSMILKGSVKVRVEGREIIVKANEGILIPANVPHEFEALEDETINLDFFTPTRQDWIDGTDTYFKKPEGSGGSLGQPR